MPYIGVKCADIKADESPGAKILPTPRVSNGIKWITKTRPRTSFPRQIACFYGLMIYYM